MKTNSKQILINNPHVDYPVHVVKINKVNRERCGKARDKAGR